MTTEFNLLSAIVARRKTTKVIAGPENPVIANEKSVAEFTVNLERAIEAAGMAPFHYARNQNEISEPWRVHVLPAGSCRKLASILPRLVELPPQNKLQGLLSGCGALVLINWLPVSGMDDMNKQEQINREHLCAAAAMTQNLLLLAESLGLPNYWASGGLLDAGPVRGVLGLPGEEAIAAAVFVGFADISNQDVEFLGGKNRPARSNPSKWCRWISPNDFFDKQ